MKELLEDYFGKKVKNYSYDQGYDLEMKEEGDYGRSYNYIGGNLLPVCYRVLFEDGLEEDIYLDELLGFIYQKCKK